DDDAAADRHRMVLEHHAVRLDRDHETGFDQEVAGLGDLGVRHCVILASLWRDADDGFRGIAARNAAWARDRMATSVIPDRRSPVSRYCHSGSAQPGSPAAVIPDPRSPGPPLLSFRIRAAGEES